MDERLDQTGFTLQSFLRSFQMGIQLRKVVACEIGQVRQFQIAPDPLGRIEFGSITREAFEMKALCGSSSQVVFDDLGAMGWTAIPNHQEQTQDQPLQLLEKGNHFTAGDGALQPVGALGCRLPARVLGHAESGAVCRKTSLPFINVPFR